MNHLGDITRINGSEITPVWCITGGSPCQDLSIAGKRAGLAGARSGLYMEQIRIVKEMREHDRSIGRTGKLVRPRYMVWENVPGAYSSNGGEDFAAVLEETVRIAEPGFSLPRLPDKQRWTKAGGMLGDGWSVAWRTHDAQYWGVPQRRRRISMVVDFNGYTAGDILFERFGGAEDSGAHEVVADSGRESRPEVQPDAEGVRRDPPKGETARERPAGVSESGAGRTGESIAQAYGETGVGYWQNGVQTLRAEGENRPSRPSNVVVCSTGNDQMIFCMATQQGGAELRTDDRAPTLTAAAGMSGNNQPVVAIPINDKATRWQGGISPSLQARMGTGGNQIPLTFSMQFFGDYKENEISCYCKQRDFKDATDLVIGIDDEKNAYIDQFGTLKAHASGGTQQHVMERMVVRRLTPLECTRLQGFPDGWVGIGDWTDEKGRVHKEADAPKYKALGNSIALPFWRWMFERMAEYLPEGATLGSLFDGIGGFPLCWESIHGKGTAIWASEIEPFAIAVTKHHFGGDT